MRYHVFQGSCGCQKALEKHLAGLKHKDKSDPEKIQITYDCALCQISCGYQNGYVKHLAGKKHKENVIKDEEKWTYHNCNLCQFTSICQTDFAEHLTGEKHVEKVNKEKERHTYKSWGNSDNREMEKVIYCCALCRVSCISQIDLEKHLAGMKHAYKANREKYTWKASNMKKC